HRLVARQRDVAGGGDGAAEAERAAVHRGDDRDLGIAHGAVAVEHYVAEIAPRERVAILLRVRAHHGAADAEIRAGAAQHDNARSFLGAFDDAGQFRDHLVGHRIAALRLIQGDAQDRSVLLGQNVGHGCSLARHALADWMARQIRSGVTGISMWVTPNSASASTTALTTAPSAPVVPPSPAPRTPSRLVGVKTWLISVVKEGRRSARGMA